MGTRRSGFGALWYEGERECMYPSTMSSMDSVTIRRTSFRTTSSMICLHSHGEREMREIMKTGIDLRTSICSFWASRKGHAKKSFLEENGGRRKGIRLVTWRACQLISCISTGLGSYSLPLIKCLTASITLHDHLAETRIKTKICR